ncbi:hypothetical protein GQ42DRAFT_164971 [Ramicandelaber brevisporus]|nr:hypothetical protein GQ42DRAFT_164971 [Ramicandelaber brevisporus]
MTTWKERLLTALAANMRDRSDAMCLQLATVRPNGFPANRTVVFRGFAFDAVGPYQLAKETSELTANSRTDILLFCTNTRSSKVAELYANPRGEACWWLSASAEQFRISGNLHLVYGRSHPHYKFAINALRTQCALIGVSEKIDMGEDEWETERIRVFDMLTSDLQSTFDAPTPGAPLEEEKSKETRTGGGTSTESRTQTGDGGGSDVKSERRAQQLDSFALMVLVPERIDYVKLSQDEGDVRLFYTRDAKSNGE